MAVVACVWMMWKQSAWTQYSWLCDQHNHICKHCSKNLDTGWSCNNWSEVLAIHLSWALNSSSISARQCAPHLVHDVRQLFLSVMDTTFASLSFCYQLHDVFCQLVRTVTQHTQCNEELWGAMIWMRHETWCQNSMGCEKHLDDHFD